MAADDDRVSVVANAIGFALFGWDGRLVTINDQGVPTVTLTSSETDSCYRAARAALAHLTEYEARQL